MKPTTERNAAMMTARRFTTNDTITPIAPAMPAAT
jgi:hypothetical protein